MKRKILAWMLILVMALSLTACANKSGEAANNNGEPEKKSLEGTVLKVVAAYGG